MKKSFTLYALLALFSFVCVSASAALPNTINHVSIGDTYDVAMSKLKSNGVNAVVDYRESRKFIKCENVKYNSITWENCMYIIKNNKVSCINLYLSSYDYKYIADKGMWLMTDLTEKYKEYAVEDSFDEVAGGCKVSLFLIDDNIVSSLFIDIYEREKSSIMLNFNDKKSMDVSK